MSVDVGHRQLVDELIDEYVAWREERTAVSGAYDLWRGSPRGERRLAFAAYVAALDREERAAALYRGLVERTGDAG
jgi:hypothetical protein